MFEESMSIPGILASMNSWFTPTVLFVLLNVMIGTIAVTSGLGAQKHPNHQQEDEKNGEDSQQQHHHQQQQQHLPDLNRSPSVLQRLKSINFYAYSYRSQETISIPTPEIHTHKLDNQTHEPEQPHEEEEHTYEQPEQPHEGEEEEEEEEQSHEQEQRVGEGEKTIDEVYSQLKGSHNRIKSDTKPASGEVPVKLPRKMRESASAKSAFAHFEKDDIVESRRPGTVREGKASVIAEVDDDCDEADEEVDAKADDFINRFKQQLKLQKLDSIVRYKETLNRGSGK